MIYKRGKNGTYWIRFRFGGRMIHESAKSKSLTIARDAERQRRRELELSINGLKERRALSPTFERAAEQWMANRAHVVASNTQGVAHNALKRLLPVFGSKLLSDIGHQEILDYQRVRSQSGARGRTVNIEVGLLRSVLKARDLWLPLAGKVRMLRENKERGPRNQPRTRGRVAHSRKRTTVFRLSAIPNRHPGAQHGHAVEGNQDSALVTG